jgi:hypothetical protein
MWLLNYSASNKDPMYVLPYKDKPMFLGDVVNLEP